MKTTIRDLAGQLGVSPSTVSKAINGTGSVSPELRQKILAAVEESNYQPNLNAKSLRTRSTKTIGVILPDVTNLYYCYLMKGVEAKCQEENFSVLVGTCNYNTKREREYFDLFRSKDVTGIISVTIGDLNRFADVNMLVSTNEQIDDHEQPSDWVSIHNLPAARDLTQYLINLGHRDIAYVTSGYNDVVSMLRQKGFTECMESNGFSVPPDRIYEGSLFYDGSYEAGRRIILSGSLPTAVICHNNTNAYGVAKAFQDAGYRIPEDISIACFDAIHQGDLYGTQFTCIMQPVEEIGRAAAELLIQRSAGLLPKNQFVQKVLPYKLVFGNSVSKI